MVFVSRYNIELERGLASRILLPNNVTTNKMPYCEIIQSLVEWNVPDWRCYYCARGGCLDSNANIFGPLFLEDIIPLYKQYSSSINSEYTAPIIHQVMARRAVRLYCCISPIGYSSDAGRFRCLPRIAEILMGGCPLRSGIT